MKPFDPNWTTPPGASIRDALERLDMSRDVFAAKMALHDWQVDDLLSGLKKITPEIAADLARVIGATEVFWLARESQFREGVARGKKIC